MAIASELKLKIDNLKNQYDSLRKGKEALLEQHSNMEAPF